MLHSQYVILVVHILIGHLKVHFFHIYVYVPVVDLRAELSSASTRP